jgi:hypothetical protein
VKKKKNPSKHVFLEGLFNSWLLVTKKSWWVTYFGCLVFNNYVIKNKIINSKKKLSEPQSWLWYERQSLLNKAYSVQPKKAVLCSGNNCFMLNFKRILDISPRHQKKIEIFHYFALSSHYLPCAANSLLYKPKVDS